MKVLQPVSFLYVQRDGGKVTRIELYENVLVERIESLRVKIIPSTIAYAVRLDSSGTVIVSSIPLEDRLSLTS